MTAERPDCNHSFLLLRQGLLVTVNGNPVDYHTIHPSLPLENGPAKTDLYTTPQYRWEPSEESSGNASRAVNILAQGSEQPRSGQ